MNQSVKSLYRQLVDPKYSKRGTPWDKTARDKQLAPSGDWFVWLILAGRGWGKTRTGAEWVKKMVESGKARRIALVGRTVADVRLTMVEGESGILATASPGFFPNYEPSKRTITWPNGAVATTYTSEKPDQLRGPEHDLAWCDELATWLSFETWDNLLLGLRLGEDPRAIVTTTPRPIKVLRDLLAEEDTIATRGSTYENIDNLAPTFRRNVIRKYEGTRLGQQELHAKLLEDVPGALWTRANIEKNRVEEHPDLLRIVVAMDPAATSTEEAAEMGIVVAGLGVDGLGYVLEDVSVRDTPKRASEVAVGAYRDHKADRIVAEVNNGGEWIEAVLRTVDMNISYKCLHASRGKVARAEPISSLYEQDRVKHVGTFELLEDQMCTYVPGEKSPDRMDALVWALTELEIELPYAETAMTGASWSPFAEGY